MSEIFKKVVFIDDDPIQNYLNIYTIKKIITSGGLDILSFTNPQEGFHHIAQSCLAHKEPTVLFLDINMPGLTGWDILEKLSELDADDVKHIVIYLLSSSIDKADMRRAADISLVTAYLTKPLNEPLQNIFSATIAHYQFHTNL